MMRRVFSSEKGLPHFEDEKKILRYVFSVCKTKAEDDRRSQSRQVKIAEESALDYRIRHPKENPETKAYLLEVINTVGLIDDMNLDMLLWNAKGYKYEELAAMFNMPLGTIKSRIFAGKKIARNSFSDSIF